MKPVKYIQEVYEKQAPEYSNLAHYIKWLEIELAKRYRTIRTTNTGEKYIRLKKNGSYNVTMNHKHVWAGRDFLMAIKMRDLKIKERDLKNK